MLVSRCGRRCSYRCGHQLELTRSVHCRCGGRLTQAVSWWGHGGADPEALLSMGLEHVGEAKPLATHLTGVWLLPSVGPSVALHVGTTCEALPTDLTDVWLLASVSLHVLVKVLFHVEVFATPLTHELLVPDMDAHVGAQLVLVLETLAAVLTLEGLLSGVLQRVHLQ